VRPGGFLARRTRTMKQCSFDAHSKSQPGRTPKGGAECLHGSVFSEWEGVREAPVIFCTPGTPTVKRIGRTPTLVLRSRSARPQKGLARRPRLDQHGCPSRRRGASKLGRVNHFDEGRSTCALGKGGRLVCFWKSSMVLAELHRHRSVGAPTG